MYSISKNIHEAFVKEIKIKKDPNELEKTLFQKSVFYFKFIKYIPWIEMIGVCNSLSMLATHPDSDIDLFIITREKRLWTVRILVTLFFFLARAKKTWQNHAGKFCLSFFIDTHSLNLEKIAIKNDIYLFHWLLYLKPIINNNNTYKKLIEENSKWCNLWEYNKIIEENKKYITYKKNTWESGLLWDVFEYILKKVFLKRSLKKYDSLWKPFWVIIDNHMLKFHNEDKRKEISEKFH